MYRAPRMTRRVISEEIPQHPLSRRIINFLAKKILLPEKGNINILDPYCGEGLFFKELRDMQEEKKNLEVSYFGLETDRALRVRAKKFARVAAGKYNQVSMTNGIFSVIFMHPPSGVNPIGIPYEFVAFGDLSLPGKYLYPGSVIIVVIKNTLLIQISQLLSMRFVDIEIGKISQDKVAIIATRSKGRVDPDLARSQREQIVELGSNPDSIPYLESTPRKVQGTQEKIKTFRTYVLNDEDLEEDIVKSSLWDKALEILTPSGDLIKPPKPLLPLNITHIATAAAAGVINGRSGDHYRKGVTKEDVETISAVQDNGSTSIETKRFISRIRIFSRDGVFDLEN